MNTTVRRAVVVSTLGLISLIAGWIAVRSADGGSPRHINVIELGPTIGSPASVTPTAPSPDAGPPLVPPTVPLPPPTVDDDGDERGGRDGADDSDDDDNDG